MNLICDIAAVFGYVILELFSRRSHVLFVCFVESCAFAQIKHDCWDFVTNFLFLCMKLSTNFIFSSKHTANMETLINQVSALQKFACE